MSERSAGQKNNQSLTDGSGRRSPDLTGMKFGRLTVLGRSDKRGPRGKRTVPLWECLCACGVITYKATDTLKQPGICMCSACAKQHNSGIARQHAGYIDGTQVSKLRSKKPMVGNGSGVRGVCFDRHSNMWRARLTFKGRKMNLGYYNTLEAAAAARKQAEERCYGEFLEMLPD